MQELGVLCAVRGWDGGGGGGVLFRFRDGSVWGGEGGGPLSGTAEGWLDLHGRADATRAGQLGGLGLRGGSAAAS